MITNKKNELADLGYVGPYADINLWQMEYDSFVDAMTFAGALLDNGYTYEDLVGITIQITKKVAAGEIAEVHEYVQGRAILFKGIGKEFCSKRRTAYTDSPDVAAEWDYDRNEGLRPEEFSLNSQRRVWWKCKNGHHWRCIIQGRIHGRGCPYCAGKRPNNSKIL